VTSVLDRIILTDGDITTPDVDTIAFPAISCGAYRSPIARAASIAVSEVAAFLGESDMPRSPVEAALLICPANRDLFGLP
jgi:O-acetyl-ADP-ribose deacetylase (regulator of RNase III)